MVCICLIRLNGLEMLFCQDPCFLSGFAKALEDTQVVFIEKGRFLEFLERHPAVLFRLCEQLTREIVIYQCKMTELTYGPIRVNLPRLLLALAHNYGVRREEGVEIEFLAAPVGVLVRDGRAVGLRCVRMRLGAPDESGRRRPIPIEGSEFTIEADTVIPAIGQEADLSFLDGQVEVERGRILIDRAGATTHPGIFAGGDVATPFGTVAHAIGSGKRAAMAIDRYLRGEELPSLPPLEENVRFSPRPVEPELVRFEDLNLAYFEWAERRESAKRPVKERKKDFGEVALSLDEEQALAEAGRCFNCGTCILCDNCLNFCPDVAIFRRNGSYPFYEINYDYCKGCGICAEECPRDAISLEEEAKWRR